MEDSYVTFLVLGIVLVVVDGQLIYHSGKGYLKRAYDDEQAGAMMRLTAVLFHLVVLGLLALVSIIDINTGDPVKNVVVKLGVVLLLYGAWGLWRPVLPGLSASVSRLSGIGLLAGAMTGAVAALTAVFVMPLVPYLQALRWSSEELIQAMGISFTVSTLALAAGLRFGNAQVDMPWGLSLAMLVPALAGMALGAALRRRLSPALFRRCFFLGLLGLGAHMLLRG